jgi:hypothetical protein
LRFFCEKKVFHCSKKKIMEDPPDFDEQYHARIPLFRKKKLIAYAYVDKQDMDRCQDITWCLTPEGYVCGDVQTGDIKVQYLMHR